jgi:UTP--glucose-1-phosphate uridylyltransferase
MNKKIRKAVFPAAGFGTRFLPATKAQPKEMLPIVDKPVIQYLVEEAVKSGIEEIIIVTGSGKRAIEDHFDRTFELEHNLAKKNKRDLLAEVLKVSDLAKFVYVRQPMPLGDGHAVLCAKELVNNEPFAVMFGDDIVDGKTPALKQLIDVYNETGSSVIGLERVPDNEVQNYGIIEVKESDNRKHLVSSLIEKPSIKEAPSNLGIIGKYVVTPGIMDSLEKATRSKDGELRLIDGFRDLIKTQKIYGLELEGKRYDTGNKYGLIEATIDFALKREGLSGKLKKYLKSLDLS